MVRHPLVGGNGLLCHGLTHTGGIDEGVLGAVTLRDNGDNGKHVTVMVHLHALLGLQPDGVVDGLVAHNLGGADINEADRLTGRNDSGDILVDGEILHIIHRFLCHDRHRNNTNQ